MYSARVLLLLLAVAMAPPAGGEDGVPQLTEYWCDTAGDFDDGSQYAKNLAELLSTLSSSTATAGGDDGGWFRSGAAGAAPDQAWGLAMCYADSDEAQWQQSLDFLGQARAGGELITELCGPQLRHSRSVRLIGTNRCVIRYADEPFLGAADKPDTSATVTLNSDPYAGDASAMREARRRLLVHLAAVAGGGGGEAAPPRLAVGSRRYTDALGPAQVLYGMAQCSRDLTPGDCTRCLMDNLAVVSDDVSMVNSTRGSVMGFSCYLKFRVNAPIHITGPAKPPAPVPAAAQATATPLMAALAAAAGAVTVLILGD
ncbi:hypothetical protein ACP4OV_005013 [Aristida adscensionis]